MQHWKPKSTYVLWVGVISLIIALSGVVFFGMRLWVALVRHPVAWNVNLALFGELIALLALLMVAGFFLYRVLAALTLAYEVDRNGVYILWFGNRAVIPIEDIDLIESGDAGVRMPWPFLQGIGYYWGQGLTSDKRNLHLFSTLPPAESLVVHTSKGAYALSPNDRDGFVQHLEQRRRLGAVKPLSPTYQHGRMIFYDFWEDPIVRWTMLLALGLNLLLIGMLFARYPELTPMVEMRFDAAGATTELRPRHQVLFLPLAGLGLSLLNMAIGLAIYRREQTGARVLQMASVLMPVLFGVAVFTIIT